MIFFCSDTHLGHFNIIDYCKRPFKTVQEMDSTIIRNWNERVKKEDTVFFLGDFCLKKSTEAPEGNTFDHYRSQLNGNIIFIAGNHDKNNNTPAIIDEMVIRHGGQRIYLTHNPKYIKEDYKLNFCGHVHEKWQFKKIGRKSFAVNLSVEQWNYRPVSINEIFQAYSRWLKEEKKNAQA